jgi:hypothetical protein
VADPSTFVVGTDAIIVVQFSGAGTYSAGTGLTLTGTVFSITNTGVTATTYGSASSVPVLAINAQGQVTSASDSAIAIAASQITSGILPIANGGTGASTLTGYVKGNGTSAFTAAATIPTSDLTGTLGVANGGTGATTLAANNVLLGNGTSALQVVAPGTTGNVLVSDGTTWVSQTPAASGISQAKVTAISMILGF